MFYMEARYLASCATTKENLKKALFLEYSHLPFRHTVRNWTTVSTSSVSVFTFFSFSFFLPFVSMSHSVQSVQEEKKGVMLAQVLAYTVFTCRLGRKQMSNDHTHTHTHTHTHHTQYTHITVMHHSNCVNSNIALRPSTRLHSPFSHGHDVITKALNKSLRDLERTHFMRLNQNLLRSRFNEFQSQPQ